MADTVHPIGIDLGTTFSVVACMDSTGRPCTIPNSEGDLTTPSVILFDGTSIVVGKEAVKAACVESDKIAQFVKREMGSPVYSKAINGEFYPPEVLQSLILEKLKRDAEAKLGPLKDAVITVPAYFNEPRRKATQDAGRMAGLNVIDIINEPTAAAIAFGIHSGFVNRQGESRQDELVLVYDLGGGTFDATLMSIGGKNYRVLATDGDVKLGGMDWDRRIVDFVAKQFVTKFGVDPRDNPRSYQRLLREAEDAKRSLSAREQITIDFEQGTQAVRVSLTRSEFEAMTADLLERTRFTVSNLLRQNRMQWRDITRLLLTGGSTRMPMVGEMLQKEAGKLVDRSLSVDEAVAHGAAIYAALLQSDRTLAQEVKITNVNSHNLGVLGFETSTGRPRAKVMIPKNTPLPSNHTGLFRTKSDNQRNVEVNVIEGGDASGNGSTPIGRCLVEDLPEGLPGGTIVQVTFSYAANGRLMVHACVPDHQRESRLEIERASNLTEAKLGEWELRLRNGLRPINITT